MAHILYSVLNLGLKNAKATNAPMAAAAQIKSGKHQSTSEEDLLKIKDHHPIVQIILSHRHVSKVLHTFIEGLQPFIAEVGEEHNSKCTHLPQRHQFSHRRVYATWNQVSINGIHFDVLVYLSNVILISKIYRHPHGQGVSVVKNRICKLFQIPNAFIHCWRKMALTQM